MQLTAAVLLRDCRACYLAGDTFTQALRADVTRGPADSGARRKRRVA
jgi:hypothetical protein